MSEEIKKEETQSCDRFTYSYSAGRRAEVEAIRKKYMQEEESKMDRLRRLDRSAAKKGSVAALTLGIAGSLVMGTGMSMAMVWTDTLLAPGILVGLIGMGCAAAAYPLYSRITQKERERIAPEILRLTDELLK